MLADKDLVSVLKLLPVMVMLSIGIVLTILFFAVGYFMPDLLRDPSYHEAMEDGRYPENITVLGKEFVNTRIMSVPAEITHPGITVDHNRLHDLRQGEYYDIDSRWTYGITVRNTADSAVWINREPIMMSKGSFYDNAGEDFPDVHAFLSKNNEFFLLDINKTMTYKTEGITACGKSISIQDFDGIKVMAFNTTKPIISPGLTELDMGNIVMRACINGDTLILADIQSIMHSENSKAGYLEVEIDNVQYDCDAVFVSAGTDVSGSYFATNSSPMPAHEKKIFVLDLGGHQAGDINVISISIHQSLRQLS